MSDDIELALGIDAGNQAQGCGNSGKPVFYLVKTQGHVSGPFTKRQLSAMWETGRVTADAEWSTDGGASWGAMLSLLEPCRDGGGTGNTVVDSLALQQNLKSKTVAVLLGLFLPFLGAFYGTAAAAIVPFVFGLIAGFLCLPIVSAGVGDRMNDVEAIWVWVAVTMCFSIWSLFWSLRAVADHNETILEEARRKTS